MAKKTNNGLNGGLLQGKRHKDGGMPAVIVNNGKPVEVETGEAIIKREAVEKYHKILSEINQSVGGNPILDPSKVYKEGGNIPDEQKSTHIQTLIFSKDFFPDKDKVVKWAVEHGFTSRLSTIDETSETFRARQKSPIRFIKDSFRTIELRDGVKAVVGKYKDERYEDGGNIYETWDSLVNMSGAELQNFYDSPEGKKAGLSASEAKKEGIKSGRESARWIIKMKKTPYKKWTPTMHEWAKRQISFISRMRGVDGPLYDENGNKTRKHLALLIWGHDPEKVDKAGCGCNIMEEGGNISNNELQKGIQTEQEHKGTLEDLASGKIDVKEAIEKTAEDHLKEDPNYYSKLETIENKIPAEAFEAAKQTYEKIRSEQLEKEQAELQSLLDERETLNKQVWAWNEQEKALPYGDEKNKLIDLKRGNYAKLKDIAKHITFQENVVKAIKNNGDLTTFTDKKGLEHKGIPSFLNIDTNQIFFDEDNILTEQSPAYIPSIDEEIFRAKGYVFDAIRVEADKYLLAVNGYNELIDKRFDYQMGEEVGGKMPEDFMQGYVFVSLDQLVLINDYYYTKAKATEIKRAEERTALQEAYYDKLPIQRREAYINQKGFYHSLPAAIRKKITQPEYEALSFEEKEKLYKPFKRVGPKRLTSKLDDNEMWLSFHNMYERFINPSAVPPKPRTANPEVFIYWRTFRDMMRWKIKDIKIQREEKSETRKIAEETAFGESNTDSALKDEYGILVKRQDGSKIQPFEIEQIKEGWVAIEKTYGGLSFHALEQNLKISHTGLKYVFASKAAGMYISNVKTIAVSFKFGENQFNNIFAHEVAHWIDNTLGDLHGKRFLTDDYESSAGKLAFTFRSKMNEHSDSDYINATKECFARAMEQYFAISNYGDDATLIYTTNQTFSEYRTYFSEKEYVSKEVYYSVIKPMIEKFLEEHKDFFKAIIKKETFTRIMKKEGDPDFVELPKPVLIEKTDQRASQKDVYDFLIKNYRDKYIINDRTGYPILFTKKGISKLVRNSDNDKLSILYKIEEIIKNATPYSVEEITKDNTYVKKLSKFSYIFESIVEINGNYYNFGIRTFFIDYDKIHVYTGYLSIKNPI